MDQNRLFDVQLDDSGLPPPSPQEEQERKVAVFDLVEANEFALVAPDVPGPYRLDLRNEAGAAAGAFDLSLVQFRRAARDYFQICEAYQDAVRRLPPAQIERFDDARRTIHEEGANTLRGALEDHARVDMATARRLFTLVCVLFPKTA